MNIQEFELKYKQLIFKLFKEKYPEIFIRPTSKDINEINRSPYGYNFYVAFLNSSVFSNTLYQLFDSIEEHKVIEDRKRFLKDLEDNFSIEWLVLNCYFKGY